jgi:hypothetical protein
MRLPIAAQQQAEIVKPRDRALQFNPVDQKNRHGLLRFAYMVQKGVLQVLFVGGHGYFHCYCFSSLQPCPRVRPNWQKSHKFLP